MGQPAWIDAAFLERLEDLGIERIDAPGVWPEEGSVNPFFSGGPYLFEPLFPAHCPWTRSS